jgi:archaemetzincin
MGKRLPLRSILYLCLMRPLTFLLCCCLYLSCSNRQKNIPEFFGPTQQAIVKVLPLGKVDPQILNDVLAHLNTVHTKVELLKAEPLPAFAYYAPRNRYRADSIIHWLNKRALSHETYIAVTASDISITKAALKDYGVMGFGFQPGKACVASPFRLKNKSNFYKVVLHEFAHTSGLPHCPDTTCYLRDAEGGDHSDKEKGFCSKCSYSLRMKGWTL